MKEPMKSATTVKVFLLFLFAFGCITAILVGFAIGRAASPAGHSPHTVSVLQPISRRVPKGTRVVAARVHGVEIPRKFQLQGGRDDAAPYLHLGLLATTAALTT